MTGPLAGRGLKAPASASACGSGCAAAEGTRAAGVLKRAARFAPGGLLRGGDRAVDLALVEPGGPGGVSEAVQGGRVACLGGPAAGPEQARDCGCLRAGWRPSRAGETGRAAGPRPAPGALYGCRSGCGSSTCFAAAQSNVSADGCFCATSYVRPAIVDGGATT